jgi:hypothetical protein
MSREPGERLYLLKCPKCGADEIQVLCTGYLDVAEVGEFGHLAYFPHDVVDATPEDTGDFRCGKCKATFLDSEMPFEP